MEKHFSYSLIFRIENGERGAETQRETEKVKRGFESKTDWERLVQEYIVTMKNFGINKLSPSIKIFVYTPYSCFAQPTLQSSDNVTSFNAKCY